MTDIDGILSEVERGESFTPLISGMGAGAAWTAAGKPTRREKEYESELLDALNGNGNRTFLKAGTADEDTYSFRGRDDQGNVVFTQSFVRVYGNLASKQPLRVFFSFSKQNSACVIK